MDGDSDGDSDGKDDSDGEPLVTVEHLEKVMLVHCEASIRVFQFQCRSAKTYFKHSIIKQI